MVVVVVVVAVVGVAAATSGGVVVVVVDIRDLLDRGSIRLVLSFPGPLFL